jgi:hypothetical protein
MTRFLGVLGLILFLGGIGHSIGVLHLYITAGLPDANRILVDIWVAEVQLLGGALYLAAFRRAQHGTRWQTLAVFGALTTLGFGVAMLPVLFWRAPIASSIPLLLYVVGSILVLVAIAGRSGQVKARLTNRPRQPTRGDEVEIE